MSAITPHAFDAGAADFQQTVIEASWQQPVLVDFWAEWCSPCRLLKPLLERLAAAYEGRFLLAKVNSDLELPLARQFGVRGIPHVVAIIKGEVVAQFTGAKPEAELRRFIDDLLPSPARGLLGTAKGYLAEQEPEAAIAALQEALAHDPDLAEARLLLAETLLAQQRPEEAAALLEGHRWQATDQVRADALASRLELLRQAPAAGDPGSLRQRLLENPDDHQARLDLAAAQAAASQYDEAVELLLQQVARDRQFADDAARKTLLQIFKLLGNNHPVTSAGRRRLASLLN